MPNYVKNRLCFKNEKDTKEIIDKHFIDGYFDFNTVEKMPEDLNIENGTNSDNALSFYLSTLNPSCKWSGPKSSKMSKTAFADLIAMIKKADSWYDYKAMTEQDVATLHLETGIKPLLLLGKKEIDNIKKYHARDWYEWSCREWGSKWNAQDTVVDGNTISFSTAWNAVIPVILKLSKQHPNINIDFQWADEDIGQNIGKISVLNGNIIKDNTLEDGDKKAYELAMELWGCADDYRYDAKKGTYVQKE